MVVIKFQNGWGASYDAEISNKPILVKLDDKTRAFKDNLILTVRELFIVDGVFDGDVEFAIKDDKSGEVLAYKGVVKTPTTVQITEKTDKKFLVSL